MRINAASTTSVDKPLIYFEICNFADPAFLTNLLVQCNSALRGAMKLAL